MEALRKALFACDREPILHEDRIVIVPCWEARAYGWDWRLSRRR